MHALKPFTQRTAGLAVALLFSYTAAQPADLPLRVSTAAPPADFLAKALETFKTDVANAKVGIEVENYPGSKLFRQGTEVPAIQRGNLEMSTMTTFEISQQVPRFGFLNRAYLFKDYDHMMKVIQGPVGKALDAAVAKEMGIEILSVAYLGTREVNLRTVHNVKERS